MTRPRIETLPAIRALATHTYVGKETVLCRVLGKFKLYADTEDLSISPHLIIDGIWEIWVSEAIVKLDRPGMTAIDIGANLGYFTLLLADLVGPSGKVHAFEPNPRMVERLRRSVKANGFDGHVAIHEAALSDDETDLRLTIPDGEPGGAYVRPIDEEGASTSLVVRARRLDSYPELLAADIIKIDAEAAEHAIWKGMAGLFATGRPLIILVEFAACRYPDPGGFLDDIIACGFTLKYASVDQGIQPTTRNEILGWLPTDEVMIIAQR
jgi:FkbM family methyltransferase